MKIRALQFFFAAISLPIISTLAEPTPREVYALKFVDVDSNTLSTADGHITVIVLTTRAGLPKAPMVGARIPDFCLGNPNYRMITLVKFENHSSLIGSIAAVVARQRLDAEARQLQARYAEKKIERDARRDIFAVVDTEGTATSRLASASTAFAVFVVGKNGELLKKWDDVPTTEQLAAVLK